MQIPLAGSQTTGNIRRVNNTNFVPAVAVLSWLPADPNMACTKSL